MADTDLTEVQSAGATKIIGSTSTGLETTPVKSTANGDLGVTDIVDAGGVHAVIAVTSTPIAVKAGAANLVNRKRLLFINQGSQTLYWGYDNTVSQSNGMPIFRNQPVSDSWGPNTTIWIVAVSGSHALAVNEGA
jgi:hypothetical protein